MNTNETTDTKDKGSQEDLNQPQTPTGQPDTDEEHPEHAALRARVEELERAAEALKDQLLRTAAEFDNYRKRTAAESQLVIRTAGESLIRSLLPVLDDFDRSLKAAEETRDIDVLVKGIDLIKTKMMKVLEQQGLKQFESVGKPFDVNLHDALLQVPRNDIPPHTVVAETERGYMLHDRVLRHAKVVVSAETPPPDGNEPA